MTFWPTLITLPPCDILRRFAAEPNNRISVFVAWHACLSLPTYFKQIVGFVLNLEFLLKVVWNYITLSHFCFSRHHKVVCVHISGEVDKIHTVQQSLMSLHARFDGHLFVNNFKSYIKNIWRNFFLDRYICYILCLRSITLMSDLLQVSFRRMAVHQGNTSTEPSLKIAQAFRLLIFSALSSVNPNDWPGDLTLTSDPHVT